MPATADSRNDACWLPRFWAAGLLLLLLATSRLWFAVPGMPALDAQVGETVNFPAIPLIAHQIRVPGFVYPATSLLLVGCLAVIGISPLRLRWVWWVVALTLGISFLLDQQRLQPWAYQSAIYALVFATISPRQVRTYLIPLAASVYVYSAAGKFDYQFAHSVGQDFLAALSRPLGGLPEDWDASWRARIALTFPTLELIAGVGLLLRPTRKIAGVAVMLIHATLIAILGPWSLDHSLGVLAWNLVLMGQAYLLVVKPGSDSLSQHAEPARIDKQLSTTPERLIGLVVLLALLAPLLERSGYWDHWPSWALYSPHTSRVDVQIHHSSIDSLHSSERPYVEADFDDDGWHDLAIEGWSLDSRGVPIYPQSRYQLALAAKIASHRKLKSGIRARLRGVSDRWTGRRQDQPLLGSREIQAALKQFWLTKTRSE